MDGQDGGVVQDVGNRSGYPPLLGPWVGLQEAEQHHEDVAKAHGHGLRESVDALRPLLLKDLEEDDVEKTSRGQALEH